MVPRTSSQGVLFDVGCYEGGLCCLWRRRQCRHRQVNGPSCRSAQIVASSLLPMPALMWKCLSHMRKTHERGIAVRGPMFRSDRRCRETRSGSGMWLECNTALQRLQPPPEEHAYGSTAKREKADAPRRHVFRCWWCRRHRRGRPVLYERSPRMRRASWMSLGMMVTRLAWMAQRLVSSKRPTR